MAVRTLWIRRACRVLLSLQTGLIALCVYHIVDAYVTPYSSEWLTADAFVPYLIVAILFIGSCMYLTSRVLRSEHPCAGLWLVPIAIVTVLPYSVLVQDASELMGS